MKTTFRHSSKKGQKMDTGDMKKIREHFLYEFMATEILKTFIKKSDNLELAYDKSLIQSYCEQSCLIASQLIDTIDTCKPEIV